MKDAEKKINGIMLELNSEIRSAIETAYYAGYNAALDAFVRGDDEDMKIYKVHKHVKEDGFYIFD